MLVNRFMIQQYPAIFFIHEVLEREKRMIPRVSSSITQELAVWRKRLHFWQESEFVDGL